MAAVPGLTQREIVCQAVVEALEDIKVSNGYSRDVARIFRALRNPRTTQDRPYICVTDERSRKTTGSEGSPMLFYEVTLPFTIWGFDTVGPADSDEEFNPSSEMNQFIGDIERALLKSTKLRAGTPESVADDMNLRGADHDVFVQQGPLGVVEVFFETIYLHRDCIDDDATPPIRGPFQGRGA